MSGGGISAETAEHLRAALKDPHVVERYRSKIVAVAGFDCLFWTGAVTDRGHGRLWIADSPEDSGDGPPERRDFVVIAHRFGFGLVHGYEELARVEVVGHICDNPLCQFPDHWRRSTHAKNRREWAARRHRLSGPLRDPRGARAVAIRDAVRDGLPLEPVLLAGLRPVDRDQLPLW